MDHYGNAYVAGSTLSKNFPIRNPIQSTNSSAGPTAFIAKIASGGSVLLYSTYLGGTNSDDARGIAVDRAGNAYIAGETGSTNFPTKKPLQPANAGAGDAFVTEISLAGDLGITETASPSPVPHGTNLTYTIRTSNAGPDTSSTVAMKDTLPFETTFVRFTTTRGSCAAPLPGKIGTLTCNLGNLIKGSTAFVTLTVHVASPAGSTLSNSAQVNSITFDPILNNNRITLRTSVK